MMRKIVLKIGGMSCSACSNTVEKYLNKKRGVYALVNLVMGTALIEYDEDIVTIDDLGKFIEESGYKYLGIYDESKENKKDNNILYLVIFSILIVIFMYISMGHMLKLPIISLIDMYKSPVNYGITIFLLTIPFLIYGMDIIISGAIKLINRQPNMDSLVSIGVIASFIYSFINLILIILGNNNLVKYLYFESCVMIIYFIKLGRLIDNGSREKTKSALRELVQITPSKALVKNNGEELEVTIDEVKKGDILIVKPGMKVAVDGVITNGSSHFDEAFITGESKYNKKSIGDKVVAGSINIDGYIEYKALKIGPESTISEIVRLVVEATNTKTPIQRIADIVSGYFVPGIIVIAILSFIINIIMGNGINDSIITFVTILVVACPCSLGLATPLAMIVSVGRAARYGILIKRSEIIENINKIDTVIFDKTGTLTYGKLSISNINNYSNYSDKKLLSIIASIEYNSTHPISKAFSKYYDKRIVVDKFKNITGIGIYGVVNDKEIYIGSNKLINKLGIDNKYNSDYDKLLKDGNSVIYVIEDNNIIALIGVKDIIRDNAYDTISKLKDRGLNIIMLSGDNEIIAKRVGKYLGVMEVYGNLLPKDKEEVIRKLKDNGKRIMMVGDGINDAPSLSLSDVGVSVSSGTDIAGDASDIILINDDLSKLVTLFNISNKTIRIVKENLFWAFIYNFIMIIIAVGLIRNISISPSIASIFMSISSLTVVFNSLRLRK